MYEIFAKLLESHNVTRYQVSKATGVPQSSLSDWSKGRSQPKYENMKKLAAYFGVTVDYLLTGETKKPVAAESDELNDEAIKFALFGGNATDAQFEEVKRFAQFVKERDKDVSK